MGAVLQRVLDEAGEVSMYDVDACVASLGERVFRVTIGVRRDGERGFQPVACGTTPDEALENFRAWVRERET